MIKKIIFATIIFLSLLSPVSSFAMEATLPELYGLGDLGYGLSIGGVWDFNGSKYQMTSIENWTQQQIEEEAERQARQFIWDYCIQRNLPFPDNPSEALLDPKDFMMSSYFNKNVLEVYNNWQTALEQGYVNADATLRMPISRQAVTDWAGYRQKAWERYVATLTVEEEEVVVNPPSDPDLLYLINIANSSVDGRGFFWRDYEMSYDAYWVRNIQLDSFYDHSYFSYNDTYHWVDIQYWAAGFVANETNNRILTSPDILTLNITDNGDNTYTGIIENIEALPNVYFEYMLNNPSTTGGSDGFVISHNAPYYNLGGSIPENLPISCSYTSDSIYNVLHWFVGCFHNINIYVDGEYWDYIDEAPADPFIPDNNSIINEDSDNPIETVDLPDTSNYEGTFDITSLFDAIKEAIIGASDNDATTSGTLDNTALKEGYRDIAGELVGDAVIPLATVIDDSFPVQGTKNYPEIPLPEAPIHNAMAGTSILAQLINACQTVLPLELVLTFWGIVFILFIIGLIKILHK